MAMGDCLFGIRVSNSRELVNTAEIYSKAVDPIVAAHSRDEMMSFCPHFADNNSAAEILLKAVDPINCCCTLGRWDYGNICPGDAENNVLNFALILQIIIVPETVLLKMGSAEVPLPVAVPSSPEIPAVNGGLSAAAAAPATESKPKKKICCACPDTKRLRDECVVEHGESACTKWIEAHKRCLRAEGFNV